MGKILLEKLKNANRDSDCESMLNSSTVGKIAKICVNYPRSTYLVVGQHKMNNIIKELCYFPCNGSDDIKKKLRRTSKEKFIQKINDNIEAYTVYEKNGEYSCGARINVVANTYLRTDPNNIEADNLENLPEFGYDK